MKKFICSLLFFIPALLLTSCYVSESGYGPAYNYYSVGYYPNYYTGYGWRNGYWSGYRGVYGGSFYNRGWYGARGWGRR